MTCTIVGNTAVIQSGFTLEKLLRVQKNAPEKLILYAEDDSAKPVFKIGFTDSPEGSFGNFGVNFYLGLESDPAQKPSISVPVNTAGDKKEYVANKYGAALRKLNKLEAGLHDAVSQIDREHAEILGAITVL